MGELPEPYEEAIIYEDDRLYACLANYPKTRGHTVVVWKEDLPDLKELSADEYDHLMERVDNLRDAMIEALGVEKVYLVYMDENQHVHWHLIPRYVDEGVEVLEHDPDELEDFSPALEIEEEM